MPWKAKMTSVNSITRESPIVRWAFFPPNQIAMFVRISILLMSCLGVCLSQAQAQTSLQRLVFASGGVAADEDSIHLSFTIGETITPTATTLSGTLEVTMGFQQPIQELDVVGLPEVIDVGYEVFPNPTTGLISLKLNSDRPITLLVDVLDARGRSTMVPTQRLGFVGSNESTFNLSALADGLYLLQIREVEGRLLKTLKIQKVQ